jgi:cell division septal protein FtsQ
MPAKKRTTTTTLNKRKSPTKSSRSPIQKKRSGNGIEGYIVPIVFITAITICLGYLAFWGYRTVTTSTFFDLESNRIDVRGTKLSSNDEIKKIVKERAKNGVWNTNLSEIKEDVEKIPYIRDAVVSRVLPDGLRVQVNEREQFAVVRTNNGDFWIDKDAVMLSEVKKNEARPAFIIKNWDSSSDKNKKRLEIFEVLIKECKDLGIEKEISEISLENENEIVVFTKNVPVKLGSKDFGRRLQTALSVIGQRTESVISSGGNPIVKYKNS